MDNRTEGYASGYLSRFPQHADIPRVAAIITKIIGSPQDFASDMGGILRKAYDEVIDTPRTGRWTVAELEKTEKTYIGTKVEVLVRHRLGLKKGALLDLAIEGNEVDIKHTVGSNWTIPLEAVGQLCLILSGSDEKNQFSMGLIRTNESYLNPGKNRDKKRSISKKGLQSVFWLARDCEMPENFMASLDRAIQTELASASTSGAEKVRAIFRRVQLRPIHRSIIEGLARQKDALKRVRGNGGARDKLFHEGLLILSGKYDHELLTTLGLTEVSHDHFISVPRSFIAERLGEPRAAALFLTPP